MSQRIKILCKTKLQQKRFTIYSSSVHLSNVFFSDPAASASMELSGLIYTGGHHGQMVPATEFKQHLVAPTYQVN